MKILYLTLRDISEENSISQKINNATNLWRELGNDVKVVSLASKNKNSIIKEGTILGCNNKYLKLLLYPIVIYKLYKVIKIYKPDIIYSRYIRYFPGLPFVLKHCAKFIIEINSNDVNEMKLRSEFKFLYNKFTRGYILNCASAFVSVTNELANDVVFAKYNKPTITIANGINIEEYEKYKRFENNNKTFVFIGSPNQKWHGLEKIYYIAKKMPNSIFNIIGSSKEKNVKIPNNVIFHGYLKKTDACKIIMKSDIGIGTLSLYTKKMNEACPLKVRQYLSQNLPIIIGYKDTDLMNNKLDFVLNIGNYENNVKDNIEKIKFFAEGSEKIQNNSIINFAKTKLDSSVKEKERLTFFKQILNKK